MEASTSVRAKQYAKYFARILLRGRSGFASGTEFETPDWDIYSMDLKRPFAALEPLEHEQRVVRAAVQALQQARILSATHYDEQRYLAMRKAIAELFEIPWTAITPRMQRLIYAINAIRRPQVMIAAGVFCGNTFTSNAGAAVGPGAVYTARALIGLEIDPTEAARAEQNVRRLDPTGVARIEAEDAIAFCRNWPETIDLLYLDADEVGGRGKRIYLDIAHNAWDKMHSGALLLAHNSVNATRELKNYLDFVRDPQHCRASMNVVIDGEGLEVSVK